MENSHNNSITKRRSYLILKNDIIYTEDEFRTPEIVTKLNKKSILKPCALRRSMSMESGENSHKKVAFSSPRSQLVDDVNFIDEKMKRSCIESREDSVGHRQRSFTVPNNFPHKIPIRSVPNFRAIHEQEFNKMESLAEHAQRKAERAKKLLTPSRLSITTTSLIPKPENNFVRNSEIRKPVLKRPALLPFIGPPNKIHRTSSTPQSDVEKKRASLNAVNFVKKESPISKIFSKLTSSDKTPKTSERTQLKGVRLNKRFELQMKYQQLHPQHGRS